MRLVLYILNCNLNYKVIIYAYNILQEIKQKTGRDALSTAYFGTIHKNRDINNLFSCN